MRPLVRAHAAGAVVLDAHPAEEPATRARLAVGARVVLRVRPQRRLLVADHRALRLPALEQLACRHVRILAARGGGVLAVRAQRQVDRDHVERRARDQLRALGRVDHVIGRRHHVRELADHGWVVAQCAQGLDVGHGGAERSSGALTGG